MDNARTAGWLRLGARLAAGSGTVLLLVLVGLGAYTRTDHFRRWVREQIVSTLQASVNGEVSLEEVSGSVWAEVRFRGLAIRRNGVAVITVPRGAVTVDLLPQLLSLVRSSAFHITSLTFTEPAIRLVPEPRAGWNLAHLLKPAQPPPAQPTASLSILFPRLKIERGQVAIRQPDGQELRLTALSVQGDLALLPTSLRASLSDLSFTLAGAGLPTSQWSGNLAYEESGGSDRVSLQSVDIRTGLSHLRVSGTVANLAAPTLALTAEAQRIAAADLGTILLAPRLSQDLAGSIRLSGPPSALQVGVSLEAADGRMTAEVTADLSQAPPSLQGTLWVAHCAVEKILRLPDLAGEIDGQVSFQGTSLATLHATVDARVANLLAYGRRIGDLAVAGDFTRGQATFTAAAKSRAGVISSRNRVSWGTVPAYETTLTVRNLDVAQVTGAKSVPPSNFNLDVWVKGSGTKLEDVDSVVKLAVRPSQFGKLTFTQGQVEGALRKGQLTLNKGVLSANDTTMTVQGQVGGLPGTLHSKLAYNIQGKNLAPWLALAGLSGEGGINISGTAGGALTALSLEGKVLLSHLTVGANSLQSGAATYTLTAVGSPQPRGHITAALTDLQAGLRLRAVNAAVTFTGLQPAEVQTVVTAQDGWLRTHKVKAQARYDSALTDVLLQELALQLPGGTWRAPRQSRLLLRNGTLSVADFSLQHDEQTVSVSGVLTREGPLDLRAQVNRLSLEELRPVLGDGPAVSGRVNADLQVRGTVTSPEVTAQLTGGALTVAGQSYAGLTAQGSYRQEYLDLNVLLRQDESHTLSVEGGLPIALRGAGNTPLPVPGEANLRIRSAGLSLAFVNLLSKQVQDVQGTVSMDVRLRGAVGALVPSGPVQIRQGQVHIKSLGQTFTDITAEVQLAQDAARLTQFAVRAGDGGFTGSGLVALQRYTVANLDLTFAADRFRVFNSPRYRAALSGRLACSGPPQRPVLTGALTLVDTAIRPDFALMKSNPAAPDPTILVVRNAREALASPRPDAPAAEQAAPPTANPPNDLYARLALDLAVTIPRETWVRLEEGSIELTGQLRVKKDPAEEPVLTGTIETVRGWYTFHGRKFRLERGNIIFAGADPTDPALELVARYTLPQYQVDVVVGGTAKAPAVSLRSEPQLEQADILSLLLFGKPANTLSKGEKVSLQSQAVQAVAGSVAAEFRQTLSESLGLDDLELNAGNTSGQKVGVGKYIVPGVFVSTSQQFGGEKPGRDVSIEYQLDDHWQFKASTTSRGNHGVDILWGKRY
ncbi:MAG TPA: translocation/assembly module TamB domain-containing protein [Candidatus Binatia bacterium]|nr:translocation/assembly module TamB domain-containing protein [Candidatus Binatia bacterium]